MLRAKELVPLSHQHHHGLVAAKRVSDALAKGMPDGELRELLDEVRRFYAADLEAHFAAEERLLLPLLESAEGERVSLILSDHAMLRAAVRPGDDGENLRERLGAWAKLLTAHIRFEERELFEAAQRVISAPELENIGRELSKLTTDSPTLPRLR